MPECCWSFGRERNNGNGVHEAGTKENHNGQGTGASEGRDDQEVSHAKAQTPCARILARKGVPEETKRRLRSTCAELDLTNLLHDILGCQDRLDAITKRRQSLVTKKRGI